MDVIETELSEFSFKNIKAGRATKRTGIFGPFTVIKDDSAGTVLLSNRQCVEIAAAIGRYDTRNFDGKDNFETYPSNDGWIIQSGRSKLGFVLIPTKAISAFRDFLLRIIT